MRLSRVVVVAASSVLIGMLGVFPASARESGIQGTPDGKRILVNKDVDTSRFVITQNCDDRSVTGNVFFTDDRAPTFLFCSSLGGNTFSCSGADACPGNGRESGIQRRPDGNGVLVSKDVEGARFAITQNGDDGSLTGNVFFTDGRSPVFLFCQPQGGNSYSCSGSDRCGDTSCPAFTFIADVTLPDAFFTVPSGCSDYAFIADVTLTSDFFSLPSGTADPLTVTFTDINDAVPGKFFDAALSIPDATDPNTLVLGLHDGLDMSVSKFTNFRASPLSFSYPEAADTISFVITAPCGYTVETVTFTENLVLDSSRTGRSFGMTQLVVNGIATNVAITAPPQEKVISLTGLGATRVPMSITTSLVAGANEIAELLSGLVTVQVVPVSGVLAGACDGRRR